MKSTMKLMVAAVVLVALLAVPAMARAPDINTLENTNVAFVYETKLNVPDVDSSVYGTGDYPPTKLVKFANDNPDTQVAGGGQQLAEIPLDTDGKLWINTAPPYMGIWFPWNADYIPEGTTGHVNKDTYIQIQHADVALDAVLNVSHTDSLGGKSVTRETNISFKLTSTYAGNYYKYKPASSDVYAAMVNIELTTPGGGKITQFGTQANNPPNLVDLANLVVIGSLEYTDSLPPNADFSGGFGDAISLKGVEAGTYTATAKWVEDNKVTGMKTPWYNQEPNSNAVSFTVLSKPITITTNKESVVRGNSFVVTVTAESKKTYWVYIRDASVSTGFNYPQVSAGQAKVNGTVASGFAVPGSKIGTLSDINLVFNTTPLISTDPSYNQTAASIVTAADGTRTIQFETNALTYDTKYTVKAIDPSDLTKYDTVDITVEKGQVTITYEGTGTYYLGETIKLTGTNTDSKTVYLFITGPNLETNGENLAKVGEASEDGKPLTFKAVDVNTDNTWSFKWDTSQLDKTLDAGTYTIYAAAQAHTKNKLSNVQYNTASVVLKKPFITASASTNTLAKGDILYVRGTAEGKPNNVFVWTFGKNYRNCAQSASVKSDASYEFKLDRGDTESLYAGQYFVVVQHPMMNGIADVQGDPSGKSCVNAKFAEGAKTTANKTPPVRISGLQASDAATALVELLNSPNIDDSYTKLSFMVEEPWIRIDTIGDKYVGDTFKITGTTNLAEGDQILMTVTSASFKPTEKTQTGEFSGSSGTVSVQKGDTYNTFSFDVDASTYKPDEYLVKAESVQPGQTTTATFNVLEGKPTEVSTPVATPVVTAVPATPVSTTEVATAAPVTTAKPQPGFGALVALVGLGAVALLVLRRH